MTGAATQAAGLRADLHRARAAITEARDQLARAEGTLTRVSIALEAALNGADPAVEPVTEHLREHRPGPPKKLAADPELRAFVEARFNRLTFDQIADDVAANFPPERRIRRTAIHDWWHRVYKRRKPGHPG